MSTARSCGSKQRFQAKIDAEIAAEIYMQRRPQDKLRAYECPVCGGYHLTHAPKMYVDGLMHRGLVLHGKPMRNCHLFTDGTIDDLLKFGVSLALRTSWLHHPKGKIAHFDLTRSQREFAIERGAIKVSRKQAVMLWREILSRSESTSPERKG